MNRNKSHFKIDKGFPPEDTTFEDIARKFFTPIFDYNAGDFEVRFFKETQFSEEDCWAALEILADPRCTADHILLPFHVISWCINDYPFASERLMRIFEDWDLRLLLCFVDLIDRETIRRLGPEVHKIALDRLGKAIKYPWHIRRRNAYKKLKRLTRPGPQKWYEVHY